MLSLILALIVAEPAAPQTPTTVTPVTVTGQPQVQPAPKIAKADQITCRWITGSGGISREVCATNKEWRREQMERQQRVADFQRRALTTGPR